MLLIVFYHSILFWSGNWFTADPVVTSKLLTYLAKWLNTFHIYTFTLVSGYIFYYLKYEKHSYQKLLPFIKTKAKRLLIPYAFIAIIWVVPIQSIFFGFDVKEIIKKFVLAISPNQLWFLMMLFFVFIIGWLLSEIFDRHFWIGLLISLTLYGAGIVGSSVVPNVFRIWTACNYIPFFWLGFVIRKHSTELLNRIPKIVWFVGDIFLFVLLQYISMTNIRFIKVITMGLSFVLSVVGSIMAFVILQWFANKTKWAVKWFSFLSKRSMTVYLLHQQIIYFFIYWLNGFVNPYLNSGINYVASLAISLVIASLLLKFKTTRFLIGEKT